MVAPIIPLRPIAADASTHPMFHAGAPTPQQAPRPCRSAARRECSGTERDHRRRAPIRRCSRLAPLLQEPRRAGCCGGNVGAPQGANAAAQPNMSKFKPPSTPLPPQFLPVYHSPPPFFTAPRCSPEKRPLLDGKGMTPRPPRPFARTPCRMPRTSLAISTRTTPRSRGTPTTKRRKPAMPPQQAACCGTSPPTSSKTPQDNSVTASFSSPPMHAKRAVTTPSRRCSLPRWPSHPAGARTRASCSASASSTPAPTRWNASAFAPTLTATSNPAQTMYSSMTSRPWERRSPNWVTSSKARADRSAAWYCLSTPAAPHGFSRPK